uniref:Uncharacterized protein n=1 Tax=Arundo donax TaxID=35708 RepID=A0A0A9FF45_ARUDO
MIHQCKKNLNLIKSEKSSLNCTSKLTVQN